MYMSIFRRQLPAWVAQLVNASVLHGLWLVGAGSSPAAGLYDIFFTFLAGLTLKKEKALDIHSNLV